MGGGVLLQPSQRRCQRQKCLDEAGSRKRPHHGVDEGRDHLDEPVEQVAVVTGRFIVVAGQVGEPDQFFVEQRHVVADDHLVLAAGLYHSDDAVECFNSLGGGLGLILENESHTGCAVGHGGDVLLASDIVQQPRRQRRIVDLRH